VEISPFDKLASKFIVRLFLLIWTINSLIIFEVLPKHMSVIKGINLPSLLTSVLVVVFVDCLISVIHVTI